MAHGTSCHFCLLFMGAVICISLCMSQIADKENDFSIIFKNYEKNQAMESKKPMSVHVYFGLMTLTNVNERRQVLNIRGYFFLSWKDEQIAKMSNGSNSSWLVSQDEICLPDLRLINTATETDTLADSKFKAYIKSDGAIEWVPKNKYTIDCPLLPTYFPFDVQRCNVTISSWYTECAYQQLSTSNESILRSFTINTEWELSDLGKSCYEDMTKFKCRNRCTFHFQMKRRPLYYIFNNILPIVVLSIIAPFVFLLTKTSGERASFSVTLFLAFLVFITGASEELPVTSLSLSHFAMLIQFLYILAGIQVIIVCLLQRIDINPCCKKREAKVRPTKSNTNNEKETCQEKYERGLQRTIPKVDMVLFSFFMCLTISCIAVFMLLSIRHY